jgi:2-octaprenyl-6-methoxyphenol hydroxylase
MLEADILVAGSGPAGMAAALGLAEASFAVTLVGPPASTADRRTTALMNPALAALDRLGVLEKLRADAASLKTMRIVDATSRLIRSPAVTFRASEIDEEQFGLNMPNATLNAALAEAVAAHRRIEWRKTTVAGCRSRRPRFAGARGGRNPNSRANLPPGGTRAELRASQPP